VGPAFAILAVRRSFQVRGGANRKLRRDRRNPESPQIPRGTVGDPPRSLSAAERKSWRELAPQVSSSFTSADRAAFLLAVRLNVKIDDPGDMAPSAYARMVQVFKGLLEAFGCTPASRNRVVSVTAPNADDDAAEREMFGPRR
jgi:phage terminase small subunit